MSMRRMMAHMTLVGSSLLMIPANSYAQAGDVQELTLLGNFEFSETTRDDGSFSTSKGGGVDMSYLWNLGFLALGPEVSYSGDWSKAGGDKSHYWRFAPGVRAKLNMTEIQTAMFVPYLAAGFQYVVGHQGYYSRSQSITGDQTYGGVGLAMPLRGAAAVNIEGRNTWSHTKYKYDSDEADDGKSVSKENDIDLLVGFSLFI